MVYEFENKAMNVDQLLQVEHHIGAEYIGWAAYRNLVTFVAMMYTNAPEDQRPLITATMDLMGVEFPRHQNNWDKERTMSILRGEDVNWRSYQ